MSKGRKARNKGLSFERVIANAFRLAGWLNAKRHLEFQIQDCQGYDIDNVEPFRIQCKRFKDYAPISAIREVKNTPGKIPMLVTKGDDTPPVACLYFYDLMLLLAEAKRANIDFSPPTIDDF